MSNLWAMRGIKKMLMDKRLNKPRLKHRSYQLKSRSWMRQLTAKGNRIERLEDERLELIKAIESFLDLVGDSHGVSGYHLNGDIAEWDEFECVGEAYELIRRIEGGIAQSEAD